MLNKEREVFVKLLSHQPLVCLLCITINLNMDKQIYLREENKTTLQKFIDKPSIMKFMLKPR